MIIISAKNKKIGKIGIIEKIGHKIPDPVIIFAALYLIVIVITALFGGSEFSMTTADGGSVDYAIKNICL